MNFSIKRDARRGRFTAAKILKTGQVETKGSAEGRYFVAEHSFDRAKSAANSSLKDTEGR